MARYRPSMYEYGPFGEVLRATGPVAKANPFRFSTKYQDNESDLVYYGYRYYNPSAGRWISRDPISESGGLNLYAFVANQPTIWVDRLGQKCSCGEDVTSALTETLDNIITTFNQWPYSQQCAACDTIVGRTSLPVANSFDILELAYFNPLYAQELSAMKGGQHAPPAFVGGEGPCKWSLTFNGKCYPAGAINYASWGVMNNLCHKQRPGIYGIFPIPMVYQTSATIVWYPFEYYTEFTAEMMARYWKLTGYGQGFFDRNTRQAIEFTKYGY